MAKFSLVRLSGGFVMKNRQAIQERRRRRKQQQRITMVFVISGAALIIAAILMLPSLTAALTPVGEFVQPPLNPRPLANANTMGDPNAPVVIEEFSDFGCSHCADFVTGTGELITQNYVATGQVYFIYHSAGSMLGHPNTPVAAEAAYCAGDQNKFWEYHDIVFANQVSLFSNLYANIGNTLKAYGEALGLDMETFNACVNDNKYADQVQQDEVNARQAGINKTPSFLINGVLFENQPYDAFQSAIESALATASQ
jgi:protein-disulfide isomerase